MIENHHAPISFFLIAQCHGEFQYLSDKMDFVFHLLTIHDIHYKQKKLIIPHRLTLLLLFISEVRDEEEKENER